MCMADSGDYDLVKVHVSKHRRARKLRQCFECRRDIAQGELYLWSKQLCDSWDEWGTCAHCESGAYGWLRRECGGWIYGGALEDLEHHITYEPRDTLAQTIEVGRIIIGMRRGWRKHDGSMMPLPRLHPTKEQTAWA